MQFLLNFNDLLLENTVLVQRTVRIPKIKHYVEAAASKFNINQISS